MSAEIKPGQVWAATADQDETYTVREVGDGDVWSTNRYGGHVVIRADLFRQGRTLLTDVATPAPLDPSKVKVGDTVTLRIEYPDRPLLTLSGETHTSNTGHGVYLGGWRVDNLPDYTTLTAHQPAPEPGPELPIKSGSVVVDVDHDMRYFRANGTEYPWISETGTWQPDEYVSRLNWRAVEELS